VDRALEGFVEKLVALPEAERPVIFVTADHGHRWGSKMPGLGPLSLEAIRLPGFLATPDGFGAGSRAIVCSTIRTSRSDLLPGWPGRGAGGAEVRRPPPVTAAMVTDTATSVLTTRALLLGLTGSAYRVDGRWRLERE
jgi:hypothetical protein